MAIRRVAILSDIHGNLEALTRVLDDIEKEGIKEIICLGDTFGYGPEQLECYDIAKNFLVHLKGNHEQFVEAKLEDMELCLEDSAFKASHSASVAIDYVAKQLLGKKEIKSVLVPGKKIELLEESLSELKKEAYAGIKAEILVQQFADLDISAPRLGLKARLSTSLPKELLDEIGQSFLAKVISERPDMIEKHMLRLQRRQHVLEIYNFITSPERKREYRIGNARFYHDNPLEPGSTKYLIDDETEKKAKLQLKNKADITQITNERFPDTECIFVGHTHVIPNIIEANGIKIVYAGSVGIPRKDNIQQKYACYTIAGFDENNRIKQAQGKRLVYFWQKTQRKMQEAGLVDKYEEIMKKDD